MLQRQFMPSQRPSTQQPSTSTQQLNYSQILSGLAGGTNVNDGGGMLGATTGALSGAGTGAAIGSVIPGIGTAIGAIAGALIGGAGGLFGGPSEEDLALQALMEQSAPPQLPVSNMSSRLMNVGGRFN